MQLATGELSHALDFVRRWLGRRKLQKIRLSPLKVLLYLESTERMKRVASPEKLKREIGVGGYNTVTDSLRWLVDHKYITAAPGTPAIPPSTILDPTEFVVTPLGKEALKPYLNNFGAGVAMEIGLLVFLGFFLGAIFVLHLMYPSFLWFEAIFGTVGVAAIIVPLMMIIRIGSRDRKTRVAEVMNSVADRD